MSKVLLIFVLTVLIMGSLANQPQVCRLPPIRGPCRAYMPRYYYDASKRQCRSFIYGGCRGNANNFKTIEKCRNVCQRRALG